MRVLVTDGENRAALAVTRSLGRRGHHVVVGERRGSALAQVSRYCGGRVTYPDPAIDEGRFVGALLDAVRDQRIDVLIPVADITTMLAAEHRGELEQYCQVPVAPANAIARAADKAQTLQSAIRLGVPIPRTVFVRDSSDVDGSAHALSYPVVVKPRVSRLRTASGWISSSVRYARTRDELVQTIRATSPEGFPLILQERIEGPGLGVFMCYKQGTPVAMFSHRRIREKPPTGGVSVLSESVALCPEPERYARALLDDLKWQGVAMVEFKLDRADGRPKLMEINGRFWGSLQLAVDAGVDFPAILLETLNDAPPQPPPPYRVGVRNRWLWGDVDSLLLQLGGRNGAGASSPGRLQALLDFLQLWQRDLYYENPKLSDLGPWWHETAEWLRRAAAGPSGRR